LTRRPVPADPPPSRISFLLRSPGQISSFGSRVAEGFLFWTDGEFGLFVLYQFPPSRVFPAGLGRSISFFGFPTHALFPPPHRQFPSHRLVLPSRIRAANGLVRLKRLGRRSFFPFFSDEQIAYLPDKPSCYRFRGLFISSHFIRVYATEPPRLYQQYQRLNPHDHGDDYLNLTGSRLEIQFRTVTSP